MNFTAIQYTIVVAALYQIPEGIILTAAGLGLVGIKQPRRRILRVGALYGLCVPVVRMLPLPFPLHTLALLPAFVTLTRFFLQIRWTRSVLAWMMSVSILILSEMLITFPIVSSLGIEFAEVFASPLKQASLSWLSCLPLLLVALVVSKTKFVLMPYPQDIET